MTAKQIRLAHPGKILREEFMEAVGLSAYALAKSLGVPLPRVNDIVREKRAISPETAVLLSAYFGTSAGYWMNLQAHYDLELARHRIAKQVARIQPHAIVRKVIARSGQTDTHKPIAVSEVIQWEQYVVRSTART